MRFKVEIEREGDGSSARRKNSWGTEAMRKDPIVEQVQRVRQGHAAKFGFDLDAICRDLKKGERKGGRKVVSLPPKGTDKWAAVDSRINGEAVDG